MGLNAPVPGRPAVLPLWNCNQYIFILGSFLEGINFNGINKLIFSFIYVLQSN
jgi:hypothetical protein